MSNDCKLEEVASRRIQQGLTSLLGEEAVEDISHFAQGASAVAQDAMDIASQGSLGLLDILENGLSSRSLRLLTNYLGQTEEGEAVLSGVQNVALGIQNTKDFVGSLQKLLDSLLSAVDEVSRLGLPEIGLDPLELDISSIPGIVESELIEVLGGCR